MQKITTKNTWSFNLLDHMHHYVKRRRQSGIGGGRSSGSSGGRRSMGAPGVEVSFARASAVLDASVKLWSYRVDDVWSSSCRVMETLARSGKSEAEKGEGGGMDGEEDEDGEDARVKKRGKRAAAKASSTLASDPSTLTCDVHELSDGAADPLFHTLSRALDAGGARGLLLVTLGVQHGCVFTVGAGVESVPMKPKKITSSSRAPQIDIEPLSELLRSRGGARQPICPEVAIGYADLSRANDRFLDAVKSNGGKSTTTTTTTTSTTASTKSKSTATTAASKKASSKQQTLDAADLWTHDEEESLRRNAALAAAVEICMQQESGSRTSSPLDAMKKPDVDGEDEKYHREMEQEEEDDDGMTLYSAAMGGAGARSVVGVTPFRAAHTPMTHAPTGAWFGADIQGAEEFDGDDDDDEGGIGIGGGVFGGGMMEDDGGFGELDGGFGDLEHDGGMGMAVPQNEVKVGSSLAKIFDAAATDSVAAVSSGFTVAAGPRDASRIVTGAATSSGFLDADKVAALKQWKGSRRWRLRANNFQSSGGGGGGGGGGAAGAAETEGEKSTKKSKAAKSSSTLSFSDEIPEDDERLQLASSATAIRRSKAPTKPTAARISANLDSSLSISSSSSSSSSKSHPIFAAANLATFSFAPHLIPPAQSTSPCLPAELPSLYAPTSFNATSFLDTLLPPSTFPSKKSKKAEKSKSKTTKKSSRAKKSQQEDEDDDVQEQQDESKSSFQLCQVFRTAFGGLVSTIPTVLARPQETEVAALGEDDYEDGGFGGGDFDDFEPPQNEAVPESSSGAAAASAAAAPALFGGQGLQMLRAERRVGKTEVEYARRAKKVDVKKLKDDVWSSIEAKIGPSKDAEDGNNTVPLGNVIGELADSQPSAVTTPFYFITLLHLANEKGLYLESPSLQGIDIKWAKTSDDSAGAYVPSSADMDTASMEPRRPKRKAAKKIANLQEDEEDEEEGEEGEEEVEDFEDEEEEEM